MLIYVDCMRKIEVVKYLKQLNKDDLVLYNSRTNQEGNIL